MPPPLASKNRPKKHVCLPPLSEVSGSATVLCDISDVFILCDVIYIELGMLQLCHCWNDFFPDRSIGLTQHNRGVEQKN